MFKWLVSHKLITTLIILNIVDVVLTVTVGSGFGAHEVYEGNPIGLPTAPILKSVFLPLLSYLCWKYKKEKVLIPVNAVYGCVVASWVVVWLVF
jgi:hypothetical protein